MHISFEIIYLRCLRAVHSLFVDDESDDSSLITMISLPLTSLLVLACTNEYFDLVEFGSALFLLSVILGTNSLQVLLFLNMIKGTMISE